eukprot:scaffold296684_cov16-Prasinocladus_malaysianus.AAC.1
MRLEPAGGALLTKWTDNITTLDHTPLYAPDRICVAAKICREIRTEADPRGRVRDNGAAAASVAAVVSYHTYSASLPAIKEPPFDGECILLQFCNFVAQPRTTSKFVYQHNKHFFA